MFTFAPACEWGVPFRGSREEVFRSGEARPLAADWPLRVRPRAGYILRPRPLITSFLVPDGAGGPRGYGPDPARCHSTAEALHASTAAFGSSVITDALASAVAC